MTPFRTFLGTKGLMDRSILEAEHAVLFLRKGFTSNARSASRRRSLEWAAALWKEFSGEELVVQSARPPQDSRLRPAVSMADEDWSKLYSALVPNMTPAAAVLRVMMTTGLRIEDVLRVPTASIPDALARTDGLLEAKVKGGKSIKTSVSAGREDWSRLHSVTQHKATVAAAVAPGGSGTSAAGSGAYMACSRLLRTASKEAELSGRAHLHRLRRTVIVQMQRAGVDVGQIAINVGHSSINTTMKYADEKHPDVSTRAQEAIRKYRGGT